MNAELIMSAKFTLPITVIILLVSAYYVTQALRNLGKDVEYSTARIFLSPSSVKALKVLMATLVLYAMFNLILLVMFSGDLLDFLLRINVIMLFTGLAYFLRTMARLTDKSS